MNPLLPRIHIGTFLKFTAICCVMLAIFGKTAALVGDDDWVHAFLYPLTMSVVCALSFMQPRRKAPRCPGCGRKVYQSWLENPERRCPSCRGAKNSPARQRRLAAWGFLILIVLFFLLAQVLAWPLGVLFLPGHGRGLYLAISIALFVAMFATFFASMVLKQILAAAWLRRPGQALKAARACASEAGRTTVVGSVTVYSFGVDDPVSLVHDPFEAAHARFERLVGEPVARDRPLQLFGFARRRDFEALFRRTFLFTTYLDGVHLPWSPAAIAVTTEFPTYRIPDPDHVMRLLLTYFALDTYRKRPTPLWLQLGIGKMLASGSDPGELARLNRRISAALARGRSPGADALFHRNPSSLIRPMRDWHDLACYTTYTDFIAHSWSVTEYLAGAGAPEERRRGFRGFLQEVDPKGTQDDLFLRHFQLSPEALLDDWRTWVLQSRAQPHSPPPTAVRDRLADQVIPHLCDRATPRLERIMAVRELGRAGYVVGADSLIELLGTDETLPREEVVSALESISGLALGDDRERWEEWWNALPAEATCLAAAAGPC